MKKSVQRTIIIVLMVTVGVSFSFAGMNEPADAASLPFRPAKVQWKSTTPGQHSIKLVWKQANRADGYRVYRYSLKQKKWIRIKQLNGKKKTTYVDKNLYADKKYKYKVCAFKTYKQKQWFNKKTKKWQTSKPKKKWRGKKRYGTGYRLGKSSAYKVVKTKGTRYAYDVKFFNQPYSGCGTGVFVKTKNPNKDNFQIYFYKSNGKMVAANSWFGTDYYDLPRTKTEEKENIIPDQWTVNGGYVSVYSFDKAETLTVKIREFPKGKTWVDGYYGRCSYITKTIGKITVKNYESEKKAWMKSVISKTTNSSMTKKQKMQAITDYLGKTSKYYKNFDNKYGEMEYLSLITDEGKPAWISHEWDSYTSPTILVEFGKMIDYPMKSMFNAYSRGSDEWYEYHWYAKSTKDGTLYGFCPMPETNYYKNVHSRKDVKKVNCLTYKFVNCRK